MQSKKNKSQSVVSQSNHATPSSGVFARKIGLLVELAREYPAELAEKSWGPDSTRALSRALARYEEDHYAFLSERGRSTALTVDVQSAVHAAALFRRELSDASLLLKKKGLVPRYSVPSSMSLGKSPTRHLAFFAAIRATVALHEAALATCMERPLQRLDSLRANLSEAVGKQAGSRLPALRVALAGSRALVQQQASLLRLAGRLAFRGQPAVAKWLHPRPRRKAADVAAPSPVPVAAIAVPQPAPREALLN